MSEEIRGIALTDVPTDAQRLYICYLMAILIDLTPELSQQELY